MPVLFLNERQAARNIRLRLNIGQQVALRFAPYEESKAKRIAQLVLQGGRVATMTQKDSKGKFILLRIQ